MSENIAEVVTGGAVLAVAAGFLLYAGQVGGVGVGNAGFDTYGASFRSAEGIGIGTDVRLAGVKVGSVTEMRLDPATFRAETSFTLQNDVALPDDTAIVVSSEGLLGGSFLELLPGGSPFNLEPGDDIVDTQSSVSIIQLLLRFVSGDEE
ncbi:MAG: outer membrane lipid asymmetry maintenance protein MlaD [Pseudomonadota bacterium]